MEMDEYQAAAMRTAGPVDPGEAAAFIALAITGEAGELSNYIKKGLFHGHELNPLVIIDELGDILWYIARAANLLGIPMSKIAEDNIEKLEIRYPDKFSTERSINREI